MMVMMMVVESKRINKLTKSGCLHLRFVMRWVYDRLISKQQTGAFQCIERTRRFWTSC